MADLVSLDILLGPEQQILGEQLAAQSTFNPGNVS